MTSRPHRHRGPLLTQLDHYDARPENKDVVSAKLARCICPRCDRPLVGAQQDQRTRVAVCSRCEFRHVTSRGSRLYTLLGAGMGVRP